MKKKSELWLSYSLILKQLYVVLYILGALEPPTVKWNSLVHMLLSKLQWIATVPSTNIGTLDKCEKRCL